MGKIGLPNSDRTSKAAPPTKRKLWPLVAVLVVACIVIAAGAYVATHPRDEEPEHELEFSISPMSATVLINHSLELHAWASFDGVNITNYNVSGAHLFTWGVLSNLTNAGTLTNATGPYNEFKAGLSAGNAKVICSVSYQALGATRVCNVTIEASSL